jgi:hypothetical protein
MESVKFHVLKKSVSILHQKHMSKYTRFASELIFRSHAFFRWLRLFCPILSGNGTFSYEFYP